MTDTQTTPLTVVDAVKFLREAANYFRNRPTKGEDMAHWSNTVNADNCERLVATLQAYAEREAVLMAHMKSVTWTCENVGVETHEDCVLWYELNEKTKVLIANPSPAVTAVMKEREDSRLELQTKSAALDASVALIEGLESAKTELVAKVAECAKAFRNLYVSTQCVGQDFNYISYEARVEIANREIDTWEKYLPAAVQAHRAEVEGLRKKKEEYFNLITKQSIRGDEALRKLHIAEAELAKARESARTPGTREVCAHHSAFGGENAKSRCINAQMAGWDCLLIDCPIRSVQGGEG
jgi:hypothetical protein